MLGDTLYRSETGKPCALQLSEKYMSVFGQYILTPEVFEQLRQDINESTDPYKEIELTSALEKVRQREGMIGVQLQGRMFDMGNFNAYRNCAKDFTNI